ncbi:MAG TPA: hypothetical protein VFE36_02690 [Candidatus Baltobacteraceae bacterium]|jgi:hypothetical protein|nr:hypothetical protein [Candidatus Baltobacteraceae bacterium]
MVPVQVDVGFGAERGGRGIAYARIRDGSAEHLLRVAFRIRREFTDDEVGYVALTAVAQALRKRRLKKVRLTVDDVPLVDGLRGGEIPPNMVLPYVRLKCVLNGFDDVRVSAAQPGDLAQRARAEVALLPAA